MRRSQDNDSKIFNLFLNIREQRKIANDIVYITEINEQCEKKLASLEL
jgi:hypothetical protein